MNLRDYLYIKKKDIQDLAKEIGYSRSALQAYFAHKTPCTMKFAKAIEMNTKGEVSAEEMILWNKKGMEDEKIKKAQAFPAKARKEFVNEISAHICAACKKKLTKAGYINKKES